MPGTKHFDPDEAIDDVVLLLWRQGWAETGIQDIVDVTGLSRSSLYATFGSKHQLGLAALERYLDRYVAPVFTPLDGGGDGLPSIAAFFGRLITARCWGARARWGCLVTALQATAQGADPEVAAILAAQHERLRGALHAAVRRAAQLGQLRADADIEAMVEHLVMVTHGINVRSRDGAEARALRHAASAALSAMRAPDAVVDTWPQGK
ncbi:TetR/AcrR family transcriptional regulator [Haloechinothrix sp. LS1_15]|uniref:TetR/AcrR family transcriptional regulator n=1 Tax=Haloechinothrix sp. LS1_15 TaxID=2652248 RepID=UPI002946CC71|nr:TetR/AcrR family transcriptional regulator [Haloechinothrix sp. LS1_15]MDV6013600.1 TetR/AcrR family transcriptional regulator [Haloechinothrix sp. LS1_15]